MEARPASATVLMFDPQNPHRIEGTSAVQVEGTIMAQTPEGDGPISIAPALTRANCASATG
jgi:hypothetical protein